MTKFIIGRKSGMTQLFDDNGNVIPATVISCEPTDGYKACKVGTGSIRAKLVNKPDAGQFKKADVEPKRIIREFTPDEEYSLGQEIKVSDMFAVGDKVDVSGVSKGKGFQGNIKRHGQKGGPSGHGSMYHRRHGSMYHRRVGSMGATSTPGRVVPGKKMPGHMGAVNCTVQNLSVVMVDGERGILVIRGAKVPLRVPSSFPMRFSASSPTKLLCLQLLEISLQTEDRAHRRQRQEAKYPAVVRDLTDRRVQVALVTVQQDPHSMLAAASSLDLHPDHTATQYLRRSRDLLLSPLFLQRLLPRR